MIPAGFGALDLLRIEAGLILFGNEFDGQVDPFEAGVGFTVPLKTKNEDFIGKDILIKRKEISPTLNKNIALCRIDVGHSELDTEVEVGKIDGHQKRIPAKIVPFPHYDPKKLKVRS